MDYLEKGSPVRQNIRQDVYNSTNFVGRVDTQSLESKSISTESLDIDFTETLSYVSSLNDQFEYNELFIPGLSWVKPITEVDTIYTKIETSDFESRNFSFVGSSSIGGQDLPIEGSGDVANILSGDLSGSTMLNAVLKIDQTAIGGPVDFINYLTSTFDDTSSGEKNKYEFRISGNEDSNKLEVKKTNDSGESVKIDLKDSTTGFTLSNDLADGTASVIRIEDNNGDAILEFFNDYLVSETIPALDYADDAAAATGGVPVGGIYHNSGTIRIRLT
jgi:hypothetical protein